MTQMTDNISLKDELIDRYVTRVIDGLDLDDCLAILHDYMTKSYEDYSLEEMKEEVEEYYPELLNSNWIMNTLQVEQLQEDIITIMESHFPNENVDEVISLLCDAVTYTFNDTEEDDLPEPDESTGWN